MQKVLLHACCAVCASYPVIKLRKENFEPVVYFYNPNIWPQNEYQRRLNELISYSQKENFELIIESYSPKDFEDIAKGYENCPEKGKRCTRCFALRLNKTAQKAKDLKIKNICTTLSISPHKISKQVFKAGQNAAAEHGLVFLEYDFKKQDGFKLAQIIAIENNMYKQTYCGCKYSMSREK